VARETDPAAGSFLQIAASRLAGDLAGALTAQGFTVEKIVLYDAEPACQLSQPLRTALAEDALEAALFFSPRTAATFVTLARDRAQSMTRIKALALSRAVAQALAPLPWKAVAVADRPEQDRLLALLDGE
jgi:uroporphyrinogen-III synthase